MVNEIINYKWCAVRSANLAGKKGRIVIGAAKPDI